MRTRATCSRSTSTSANTHAHNNACQWQAWHDAGPNTGHRLVSCWLDGCVPGHVGCVQIWSAQTVIRYLHALVKKAGIDLNSKRYTPHTRAKHNPSILHVLPCLFRSFSGEFGPQIGARSLSIP